MKTAFSIGLLLVVTLNAVLIGQPLFHPDSLQHLLKTAVADEDKSNALLELAKGYLSSDPDQSIHYSAQLLIRAKTSGNEAGAIQGYLYTAKACMKKYDYETAVIYCDSAIQLATSAEETGLQAEVQITKGSSLFYGKGPEYGLPPYRKSYELYTHLGDSSGMSSALNGMGVMFKKMAQYDSAVTCFYTLVTIAERQGYEDILGKGYLNLGILYQEMLDLEKAAHYLDLSIPINQKYRPDLVALAHMNIGLVHLERKEYQAALTELQKALDIYLTIGNRHDLANVYNNFGNVYYKTVDLKMAGKYYTLAKEIYKSLENWYCYGQVYNNLALVEIDLGNYDLGFRMLDSSLALATETSNLELEALAYRNKYYAYKQIPDYQKALENFLIHDSLQDIIFNLDMEKLRAGLEMKYQNEKKQAQILELEKNNLQKDLDLQIRTKRANIYLFTGIGLIALVTFTLLYLRQRAVKDKIIAQQRIRQLEEEKKLLAARSLVEGQEEERKRIARELHDGLGVLLSTTKMQFSVIHDKSPGNRKLIEKAAELLEQASSDVRKISHNMMPGLLTKLGLFEAVMDLFEKVAETEGLNVRTDIPEEAERLPENKEIMIYRIIQELVNNTLKHAGAKNMEIQMQMLPGKLDILYSDDGKGFDVKEKLQSKSLGLSSLQSRINFLNGTMQLHTAPGEGVSYQLTIPLS